MTQEVRLIGGPLDGLILQSGKDDLIGFPTVKRENSPFKIKNSLYKWSHTDRDKIYLKFQATGEIP